MSEHDSAGSEAAQFEALRPKLFGIAYRMLQVKADAEDAVQEAWLRLTRSEGVDSVEGFLITAVTRICIDELRSARVQRETYVGPWLPEPLPTADVRRPDPESDAEHAELLSMALLQIIDRLDPVERAVFLLREAFSYSYKEIAAIVGKREDHCRQIARRATERVHAERPAVKTDAGTHERLLSSFLAAAAEGDLDGLEELLTEDVVLYSDGGGKAAAATNPLAGPQTVARFMAGISSKAPPGLSVEFALLNTLPAAVIWQNDQPVVAMCLDVVDERIRRVFMIRNPDKLSGLRKGRTG